MADTEQMTVIAFAILGLVQIAVAMLAIWLVVGHIIRFTHQFNNQKLLIISVIGCLFTAFIQGLNRSFVLSNVFLNTESVLESRCNDLFWFQIFILQLNQYLMYIYLLSRIRMLNLLQSGAYHSLLLLLSFVMIFSTVTLPWYNIASVSTASDNSQIMICINESFKNNQLFEDYVILLSFDAAVQFILFIVFMFKSNKAKDALAKRVLFIGAIVILFNLGEFVLFIKTEATIHSVRFIVYCLVILFAQNVFAKNEENWDGSVCCWCLMEDEMHIETVAKECATRDTQLEIQLSRDDSMEIDIPVKRDESIGLLADEP